MTVVEPTRLERALAAIDAANAADPNTIPVRGAVRPKELAHAEMVSEWVGRLRPDAAESLRLAARAHHIRRWTIPRSSFPEGRIGYLRWRRSLHDMHAGEAERILREAGYEEATIARVQTIIRKQDLAHDPDVQALEDALCLVFLETQLDELAARLADSKMVDILRKTLRKMSPDGKRLAAAVKFSENGRALLGTALQESTGGNQ